MTDWGDIIKSTERFPPIGARHGLQLITDLVRGVDERGPILQVELHSDDLRLLMHRYVAVPDGAEWIAALTGLLDVPEGELPHPDRWAEMTDAYMEHRQALDGLPVLDDPRG